MIFIERRRQAWRQLADIAGALFLRRAAISRLLDSGPLVLPIALLTVSMALRIPPAASSESLLFSILDSAFLACFWILVLLAVAEPVLSIFMRSTESDPLLFYWFTERRSAVRTACAVSFAVPLLISSLAALILPTGTVTDVLIPTLATMFGYSMLTRMIVVGWRFSFSASASLALAPLIIAMSLAMVLVVSPAAIVTAAVMFVAIPWAAGDLWRKVISSIRLRILLKEGLTSSKKLEEAVEAARMLRGGKYTTELLAAMDNVESESRPDLKVPALVAAGMYFEAVDTGLSALEGMEGKRSAKLHLALSEACLRSDDLTNAAAHAHEASDLGGSPRALLYLALASLEMGEVEAGLAACRRIIAFHRRGRGKESTHAARWAKALLRRYEYPLLEEF